MLILHGWGKLAGGAEMWAQEGRHVKPSQHAPERARAGWMGALHAVKLLCVYLALVFTGPGKYSISGK
jgi:uncharacterized membrane protein YphA (DoxX/SURF4 family)